MNSVHIRRDFQTPVNSLLATFLQRIAPSSRTFRNTLPGDLAWRLVSAPVYLENGDIRGCHREYSQERLQGMRESVWFYKSAIFA